MPDNKRIEVPAEVPQPHIQPGPAPNPQQQAAIDAILKEIA